MTRSLCLAAIALCVAPAAAQTPTVQLLLSGTVSTGATVSDQAAYVRLLPNALPGWDVNDASKLTPFSAPFALLAPVGERDGAPYRLAVNSLPNGAPGVLTAPVHVPVDFRTTHSGSFTIGWNGPAALPAGWGAHLRDFETGARVDLRAETSYAFTSAATDWTGRFQLVLVPAGVVAALDVFDGPGWRLLSAPVAGLTVADLAALNLVQGVPGLYPPPQAAPNLYTAFGPEGYAAPASAAEVVEPGRGFFWYWYDGAFGPFEGGTSRSVDLQGFTLSGFGAALTEDVQHTFAATPTDFYLVGNPFAAPLAVDGLSVTTPGLALATTLQAFSPAGGSYVPLFASNPGTGQPDLLAPWQGAFAQVATNPSALDPTLSFDASAVQPGADAPFHGRAASGLAPYLHFVLDGTTAGGATTRDEAAWIRLLPDALPGWDRHDGTKLVPMVSTYALIAPVGERDGQPYRLSVNSLPLDFSGDLAVPIDLTSTHAGSFQLSWTGAESFPEDWLLELVDTESDAVYGLRSSAPLLFEQLETDWTRRFEVRTRRPVAAAAAPGAAWRLDAPTPNPASGEASLSLHVDAPQRLTATLLDALGRTVRTLLDADVAEGVVRLTVDTRGLAPGAYAVQVIGPAHTATQRLVVVR